MLETQVPPTKFQDTPEPVWHAHRSAVSSDSFGLIWIKSGIKMQMDVYTYVHTHTLCLWTDWQDIVVFYSHVNATQGLNHLLGAGLKPYIHWRGNSTWTFWNFMLFCIHLWEMFDSVRDTEQIIVLQITTHGKIPTFHAFIESNRKNSVKKEWCPELLT